MPVIVLVGAQWGDEGKGKATDLLGAAGADPVDYVVRYQGGNNAGHTVVIGDQHYALHLLPSGILSPGCTPVIANGVVIDPGVLLHEIKGLQERDVDTSKLLISGNAHLITPYHTTLDKTRERFLGKNKIGTTGRGIGPAYADKVNRIGVRVQDLFDEKILRQKIEAALVDKNPLLVKIYNRRAITVDEVVEEFLPFADALRPHVTDTSLVLNRALDEGKLICLEGSQGTLLDVDHGTYPFVTSSNPTSGGACTGSGIGPTRIDRVCGILKAYTTRVGSGPFPTELHDQDGEFLRRVGHEVGVTTGRARRCGWFDAVISRYATRVNGLTDFFLTKLDVLTGLEQIPVCVAYDIDGVRHDEMPMSQTDFFHAVPVYEELPGWTEDITGARSLADLPKNAQAYVAALEEMSGAQISAIGVGPGRDQTIEIRSLVKRRNLGRRSALSRAGKGRDAAPRWAVRLDSVKVLVIGGGGREHALCLALSADPGVTELHCAPGNAGIAELATLHPVNALDPTAVADLADALDADLVVVGPEGPLVAGAADAVRLRGIACFGPSAAAAVLEGSKAFAKEVMAYAEVPTAMARVCDDIDEVAAALDAFGPPYVVKDDGLAAGKGVVVTEDRDAALAHAKACSGRVVIEEFLDGPEVSVFALTDGQTVRALLPAQDFKRVGDGDAGPNTGGMGAYCPLPWAPADLLEQVTTRVLEPTIAEMRRRGTPFAGLLYAGLAMTSRGMRVVEFNARFGDPETQVVLALLRNPLGALLEAAAIGTLDKVEPLNWREGSAVTVVMAAHNYPGTPRTGDAIGGLDEANAVEGVNVIHAGTKRDDSGVVVSAGGRVLCVTATGADLTEARSRAYAGIAAIDLDGAHHRTDIGLAAERGEIAVPG